MDPWKLDTWKLEAIAATAALIWINSDREAKDTKPCPRCAGCVSVLERCNDDWAALTAKQNAAWADLLERVMEQHATKEKN